MTAQSMREIPRPEISTARPAPGDLRPWPAAARRGLAGHRVAVGIPPERLEHSCHRPAQDHQSEHRPPLRIAGIWGAVDRARGSNGGLAEGAST